MGGLQEYCHPEASFSAQSDALAEIDSLEGYTNWMKGLLDILPDGGYETKSFAVDEDRNSVCAYAVFRGTHTGEGGPVPPTRKKLEADYVYVMSGSGAHGEVAPRVVDHVQPGSIGLSPGDLGGERPHIERATVGTGSRERPAIDEEGQLAHLDDLFRVQRDGAAEVEEALERRADLILAVSDRARLGDQSRVRLVQVDQGVEVTRVESPLELPVDLCGNSCCHGRHLFRDEARSPSAPTASMVSATSRRKRVGLRLLPGPEHPARVAGPPWRRAKEEPIAGFDDLPGVHAVEY